MVRKLVPLICLVLGLAAGIGAGVFLGPKESDNSKAATAEAEKPKETKASQKEGEGEFEYLKLTKQFVVPVVQKDQISALVTVSLSLETTPGLSETFYAIEPKLRDRFLQVLFDHANIGGFDGAFTESGNLNALRKALLDVARKDLGEDVSQVLIMSVNRQNT